ncbi:MAG: hypothetical protein BSR46_01600 [Candidatus Dactylopiibacterium carminicum]|nr:MAG: hypothetical protein BSR46_01600 [Candidatus Dactylopiibacterium carminicum]
MEEIAERALARNPDVQMKQHEYKASGFEQDAARGGLRPRIDVQAYAGRERYDPDAGTSNYFNHPGAIVELRQLLFDGGATRGDIRRLGYARVTRYYELLQAADDVAFESSRAYLDVLRYRQLLELTQDNWQIHKEIYDQINERTQAGVGRRVDLEQARGRLALAQSNWLTDMSNLHDVSARFERVVGEIPPVLADAPNLTGQLPPEQTALNDALQSNPGFIAAVYNLRAARAQTDVRRAARSPTLEFRASAGSERNRSGFDGSYNSGAVQLMMNYNLYRGGADSARIRQALENFDTALAAREKSCRDIRQVTSIAWSNIRKLREQMIFLNQNLQSTQRARDAYRQQFDIGQRTLLDLLDTENELFQARRAYAAAQFDLQQAEFQVLSTSHRLLPSLGLAPVTAGVPPGDEEDPEDSVAYCSQQRNAAAINLEVALPLSLPPPAPILPAAPMQTPPPAPQAALPPSDKGPVPAQCEFAANDWAAAWSARDLNKYLGYYSTNFQPMTRADREDWKRFRAERLNKEQISVSLNGLQVKQLSENSCEVSFAQRYRSSNYNDDVNKRLVLRYEGPAGWKIVQEVASGNGSSSN